MSQTLASIADTAQVVDGFIVMLFGSTYGLVLVPEIRLESWSISDCISVMNPYCVPFGPEVTEGADISLILTVGYLALAVLIVPMCYMNLDDNIFFQIISFVMLLSLSTLFIAQYLYLGI